MKIKFILLAVSLPLFMFLLSGCTKDSSTEIIGSYTYKTSGTVTLMPAQLAGLDAATLAQYKAMGIDVDPVVVGLYPEQGQLHVVKSDDGNVLVTFNDLLGNADIAEGSLSGTALSFQGKTTKAAQLTDGVDKIGAGIVKYSGNGRKYDDMLLLDLEYQGAFTIDDVPMVLLSSDVHCVAQFNK